MCILFSLLCLQAILFSQDVILRTQADVDAFDPATTVIDGSLLIGDATQTNITDISNLSNITMVNGGIGIDNTNLRNLDDLSNLENLNGYLRVTYNSRLFNVDGLSKIETVNGYLALGFNGLRNIDGLSQLKSIAGNLSIRANQSLANINGISNLSSIGGYFVVTRNSVLSNLDALSNLESVGGYLEISENDRITKLDQLNRIETIGGDLTIKFNPNLSLISGASTLRSINGGCYILENRSLVSIDNILEPSITNPIKGDIEISNNGDLTSLDAFSNITTLSGNLTLNRNDALINLNGFGNLSFIEGSLDIYNSGQLRGLDGLSKLCSVRGNLLITYNQRLSNLNGLSNLKNIDGDLFITTNSISDISGLSNLTIIKGSLKLYNNYNLTNLNGLSSLNSIGGNLNIDRNSDLINLDALANINSIGGNLSIFDNLNLLNIDGLSNLLTIDGGISIHTNILLKNLNAFSNLTTIGSDLVINGNSNLLNIDGFSNLNLIAGDLLINNIPLITNLDALSNVTSIEGDVDITSNAELIHLDGLSNLVSINGKLNISRLDALRDINGLSNVGFLGGRIDITRNPLLSNVDGLIKLDYIDNNLTITENPNLMDIAGLANVEYVAANLIIKGNIRLENCCGIVQLLINLNSVGGIIDVSNNNVDCGNLPEIIANNCFFSPVDQKYRFKGYTRLDLADNECRANNTLMPFMSFSITDEQNVKRYAFGNSYGLHEFGFPEGTFKIEPKIDVSNVFQISPESVSITFPSSTNRIYQDFCVTPLLDTAIINIDILPLSQARPGFDSQYKIICSNRGTLPVSGDLTFTYPTDIMDFIEPSGTDVMEDIGLISWKIEELQPFQKEEYIIEFNLNKPTDDPALVGGEVLDFFSELETNNLADNKIFDTHISQTVVNSFDPNDKTCLEGNILTPEMIGDYVHYMIRFENTGTANAINVAVTDVINTSMFDLSTLEIVDTSHEMETRINDGSLVEFIFRNINLPFMDDTNDGYVVFKIRTLSSLVVGDIISNTADIFFDFNPPITTNTETTTFQVRTSTIQIPNLNVEVYPNPASDVITIKAQNNQSLDYLIFDTLGKTLAVPSGKNNMDVSSLDNGTYILQVIDKATEEFGVVRVVIAR